MMVSLAVQRAADHGNRDRRHETQSAGDDDVDERRRWSRRMTARAATQTRLRSPGALSVFGGTTIERLELQEALLADALHVHQLLDPLEAAALGPVLDDPFRGLAADARQRLELIDALPC